MRRRRSCIMFMFLWIALLSACDSGTSTPESPGPPGASTPTIDLPQSTDTPDVQAQIEAATLLSIDFEDGYPPELYDWNWHVVTDADGNSVFCNDVSDDWNAFLFGLDTWDNYVVSLRMKFLSASDGQAVETYIRVNRSGEGYRASVWNNEWASVGYYPTPLRNNGSSVSVHRNKWFQIELRFVGENLEYFLDGESVVEISDDKRSYGLAGVGVTPNTEICVDDILVWGLDENGDPLTNPGDLAIAAYDGTDYSIEEKVENRPTIPVFYPWASNCGDISNMDFDCDSDETPYSLVWIAPYVVRDLEITDPLVLPAVSNLIKSDGDTLYLIKEEWHAYGPDISYLSPDSKFYLDEVFNNYDVEEYGLEMMIDFEHPDWPGVLADKALHYKNAGFDGMMFDWWTNNAGNGRSKERVEIARMAIAKAIREKVGDDFVLLGNVGQDINDPTSQYLSGVFLELAKPDPSQGYPLTYDDEVNGDWPPSIERMEDLLIYWDENLQWPRIVAFEPWKITTDDYITDRYTEENERYAKLFAAMAVVIPENGYILYADNNDDWDGGDHQHAYYDFYLTDFGKPISDMVTVVDGVAYKRFERGLIAYNRTTTEVVVTLPYGKQFTIGPLEGLFLEGYFE
jgi:hypothetical protein